MATYKKKGSKSKSSRNKLEELENKSATAGIINTLDDGASKTEEWVATNQKYIFITIAVVASLVFGYLGFDKFIQQPAEVNAMNEMHPAQVHFESANQTKNDSLFNLALNGADGKLGMIDIIENYSGTKASNLANYYAGMSYLNLNDYQNSIKYLSNKHNLSGPYSADTIFLKENRKKFDVIVGMYHDQVLTPLKTLFEYDAINITLGLPFIRISPDHGPNEKMLGQNKSNPTSLLKAIQFLDKN